MASVKVQYVPVFIPIFVPVFVHASVASDAIFKTQVALPLLPFVSHKDRPCETIAEEVPARLAGMPPVSEALVKPQDPEPHSKQHNCRPVSTFTAVNEKKHFELSNLSEEELLVNEAINAITTSMGNSSSCVSCVSEGGQHFFGHSFGGQCFESCVSSSSHSSEEEKKYFKMASRESSSPSVNSPSSLVCSLSSSLSSSLLSWHQQHHQQHHLHHQHSSCFSGSSCSACYPQSYLYPPTPSPTGVPPPTTTTTTTTATTTTTTTTTATTTTTTTTNNTSNSNNINNWEKLVCSTSLVCCCQKCFDRCCSTVDRGFDQGFVCGSGFFNNPFYNVFFNGNNCNVNNNKILSAARDALSSILPVATATATLARLVEKEEAVQQLSLQQQLQLELELPLRLKRRLRRTISSPVTNINVEGNTQHNCTETEAEADPPPGNRKPKRKKPRNKNKAQEDIDVTRVTTGVTLTSTVTTNYLLTTTTTTLQVTTSESEDSNDESDDCLQVLAGKPTFLLRSDFISWGNIRNRFAFEAYISNPLAGGIIVDNFEAHGGPNSMKLSAGAYKMLHTPNAGGNSVWSEVLSYELLHSTYGAHLRRTEMEIEYWPESKITDYSITISGRHIGVSVTRAINFLDLTRKYKAPFTKDDAHRLLSKKLFGVLASSSATVDKWEKQILHVWTTSKTAARLVVREYHKVDPTLRADTVVIVTLAKNADWLF